MTKITGICPVCDANVSVSDDTVETEIISCSECESRLVVEKKNKDKVELAEAPEVEEDWGE